MPRFGSVCDDSVCRVPKLDQLLDRPLHLRAADRSDDLPAASHRATAGAAATSSRQGSSPSLRTPRLLSPLLATGICAAAGLGEPQSQQTAIQGPYSCCARSTISSAAKAILRGDRSGDVFDPNQGQVQAKVPPRHRGRSRARDGRRQGRAAGLGRDQPAAPRPGHVQVQGTGRSAHGRARPRALVRAWQGHRRRQGRRSARA